MMNHELKFLPIEYLQRGQYQPRETFKKEALEELAQSIRTQGLIEPLVVRRLKGNQYEIIAGERRWRAAMLAGLDSVPCVIGELSNEQAAAVTLIENIQRENLNLLEEAQGYQCLLHEFHFHQDDIARLVGKSRSHIANILRLLNLCEPARARVRTGELTLGHARMLVGLSEAQQTLLAAKVCTHNWSVRKLESEVRLSKRTTHHQDAPGPDKAILRLQTQLAEQLGTPVQITTHPEQGGWLNIKFYDNDTLSGLLERLGLSYTDCQ